MRDSELLGSSSSRVAGEGLKVREGNCRKAGSTHPTKRKSRGYSLLGTLSSLRDTAGLTPPAILSPTKLVSAVQSFSLCHVPSPHRFIDSRVEPTQMSVQTPTHTGRLQPESPPRSYNSTHTSLPQHTTAPASSLEVGC